MPTPRAPTAVLKARGTLEKYPARAAERAQEPAELAEIGEPPLHLDLVHAETWREVVGLLPKRVTAPGDVLAFEQLVRLTVKMRFFFDELTAAQMSQFTKLLTEFGMTPASRSKVRQAPDAPKRTGFGALDDDPPGTVQ